MLYFSRKIEMRQRLPGRTWRDIYADDQYLVSREPEDYDKKTKILVVDLASIVGTTICIAVILVSAIVNRRFVALPLAAATATILISVLIIIRKGRIASAVWILYLGLFFVLFLIPTAGLRIEFSLILSLLYPQLIIFLLGRKKGLIGALLLIPVYLALGLFLDSALIAPGSIALAIITAVSYIGENRKERLTNLMRMRIYHDPLTNLPSRALLIKHIAETESPALLLLNIDDFKEINVTYGYRAGDEVLRCVGERLEEIVPDSVVGVYRLSGDEFAILMNRGEDPRFEKRLTHVASLVTRFLRHEKCAYQDIEIRIRTSIGISMAEDMGVAKLFACADLALQTAKGTNRSFLFYKEALDTKDRYAANIKWTNVLTDALDNGRVVPYYQPIVNNKTGKTDKYECLVRLIDGEGQIVGPNSFLAIAKKTRLYTRMTKTILKKATEYVRESPADVSINLSVEDIFEISVVDYIKNILLENPSICSRICFEITESEGIKNFEQVSHFIREIKGSGCRIAIDDFGTGYSNFDYLFRLKVDYLKIDGSLIRVIHRDQNSRLIVENIVAFTRQMGIQTIAEYVESEEIQKKVEELQIDFSQGYYLGEPKPASRSNTTKEDQKGTISTESLPQPVSDN